jgi:hypothetical protein
MKERAMNDEQLRVEALRAASALCGGTEKDVVKEADRIHQWLKGERAASPASTAFGSHASAVLYPAIEAAMNELDQLPPAFNFTVNRAFNILHGAFWSECPAPASASPLRTAPCNTAV